MSLKKPAQRQSRPFAWAWRDDLGEQLSLPRAGALCTVFDALKQISKDELKLIQTQHGK